jgi:hypothetical protein
VQSAGAIVFQNDETRHGEASRTRRKAANHRDVQNSNYEIRGKLEIPSTNVRTDRLRLAAGEARPARACHSMPFPV